MDTGGGVEQQRVGRKEAWQSSYIQQYHNNKESYSG